MPHAKNLTFKDYTFQQNGLRVLEMISDVQIQFKRDILLSCLRFGIQTPHGIFSNVSFTSKAERVDAVMSKFVRLFLNIDGSLFLSSISTPKTIISAAFLNH